MTVTQPISSIREGFSGKGVAYGRYIALCRNSTLVYASLRRKYVKFLASMLGNLPVSFHRISSRIFTTVTLVSRTRSGVAGGVGIVAHREHW
jgi:hypothetical protein